METIQLEVPLFCHLIRLGSYQAVAPGGGQAEEQPPNAVLHADRLELMLNDLPKLVIPHNDIRKVWYYSGRLLPKSMLCLLLEDHVLQHVALAAILDSGAVFRPSSADLSVKLVSLFPCDEQAAVFKHSLTLLPWLVRGRCLSSGQARELVLATAGQQRSGLSFSLDTLQPLPSHSSSSSSTAQPHFKTIFIRRRRRRDQGRSLLKSRSTGEGIEAEEEERHVEKRKRIKAVGDKMDALSSHLLPSDSNCQLAAEMSVSISSPNKILHVEKTDSQNSEHEEVFTVDLGIAPNYEVFTEVVI